MEYCSVSSAYTEMKNLKVEVLSVPPGFFQGKSVVRECEIVVLSFGHVFKPAAFGLVPYCPMSCIES